ncbi:MAG: hypothetical protein N3A01_06230 [Bacteroidales bacterium]|nr:hypothetical protein [Bacteroidales bacterium]
MVNIIAVSYINTLPYIYSIKNSPYLKDVDINLQVVSPALCARAYHENRYDFLLMPTGTVDTFLNNDYLPYGIIANKKVDSVLILSNNFLEEIDTIITDSESVTSVKLFKVISKYYLKKKFNFVNSSNSLFNKISKNEGILVIGDKALLNSQMYKYSYDLAQLWWNYTKLPFVFAYWIKKNNIDINILQKFENSIKWGIEHRNEASVLCKEIISKEKWLDYINNKIIFNFTQDSLTSLNLFYRLSSNHEF